MISRHATIIATCLLAVVLAASCGPSDSSKEHGRAAAIEGPVNPCQLLTRADAARILHAAVTEGRIDHDENFAPGTKCSYFTAAPMKKAGGVWSVCVEVHDQATFDNEGSYFKSPTQAYQRGYKAAKSAAGNEVQEIAGLGDGAYWDGQELIVLDRGVEVEVAVHAHFDVPPGTIEQVQSEEDAAEMRAATELAKDIVLPRLEKL